MREKRMATRPYYRKSAEMDIAGSLLIATFVGGCIGATLALAAVAGGWITL